MTGPSTCSRLRTGLARILDLLNMSFQSSCSRATLISRWNSIGSPGAAAQEFTLQSFAWVFHTESSRGQAVRGSDCVWATRPERSTSQKISSQRRSAFESSAHIRVIPGKISQRLTVGLLRRRRRRRRSALCWAGDRTLGCRFRSIPDTDRAVR